MPLDMIFIWVKIWGCGQLLVNEIYLFIKRRKDTTMLFILTQFINLCNTLTQKHYLRCRLPDGILQPNHITIPIMICTR